MSAINRDALLKAAEGLLSSSSEDNSSSEWEEKPFPRKRHAPDKKSKHSKKHKKHKRHKRSEYEKIQELERRAASIGATNLIPRVPGSLSVVAAGKLGTATAADVAVLDTGGDANNAIFESLYASSVPRYTRLDPFGLVGSTRNSWQASLQQPDKDAGNTRADRYFKGRFYMQERNRKARRIHLSDLRPKHTATAALQHVQVNPSCSGLLIPDMLQAAAAREGSSMFPAPAAPALVGSRVRPQQTQHPSDPSSTRRLVVPAPAFIPLTPPTELLEAAAAAEGDAGNAATAAGGVGGRVQPGRDLDPQLLVEQVGVSVDELVLRATRAWNIAVRERPHDEQLWLDFAAFQHTAANLLHQQRGRGLSAAADAATAEKQVSLLTRGLTYLPQSPALLLALLRCYAVLAPDAAALEAKWRAVLDRQGGCWTLWREYIALRQSSYATFSISSVQRTYINALHALSINLLGMRRRAFHARKQLQQHQQQGILQQQIQQQVLTPTAAAAATGGGGSASSSVAAVPLAAGEEALELQLVQLLLGLIHLELAAGHTEQAVAKIQAVLEWHLFPPPTPPGGTSALLRLFAAYWASGVPRIGEHSARGWAYWCHWHAMGLPQPAAAAVELDTETAEPGGIQQEKQQDPSGWSGWFEVPTQQQQQQQQGVVRQQQQQPIGQQQQQQQQRSGLSRASQSAEQQIGGTDGQAAIDRPAGQLEGEVSEGQRLEGEVSEDEETVEEEEQPEEELDEVDLMLQLGIQLEEQLQELEQKGLPPHIMQRWVQQEASHSSSQWQPQRPNPQNAEDPAAQDPNIYADPAHAVGFDSVEPCLFIIRSQLALRRLVLGCVELLGAPLGHWCCSNSPTPMQQLMPTGAVGSSSAAAAAAAASAAGRHWSDASAGDAAAATAAVAASKGLGHEGIQQQQTTVHWYQGSDERWQWLIEVLDRLVAGGPGSNWHELCQALLLLHASKPSSTDAATGGGGSTGTSSTIAAAVSGIGSSSEEHVGSAAAVVPSLLPLTIDGAAAGGGSSGSSLNSSSGSSSGGWPSAQQLAAMRAAAKQLLGDQRDNLLLYAAYACCEAAAGQVKTARKIWEFALTLASATAVGSNSSSDIDKAAAAAAMPLLALHLAQMELAAGGKGGPERAYAALHSCLARQQYQAPVAAKGHQKQQGAAQLQQQQQQQTLVPDKSQLTKARRGFQDRVPELLAAAGGRLSPAAAATVAAAALFELTIGLLTGSVGAGVDAAAVVYRQISVAVPEAIRAASEQHEQLQFMLCHMLVKAATGAVVSLVPFPPVQPPSTAAAAAGSSGVMAAAVVTPARARSALAAALQMYPHFQGFLNLQVQLDHACYTLAGLRRQLAALTDLNPSPVLWIAALQAEASRPGGRVRLRALFEKALAAPSPQQWHLQHRWHRQQLRLALETVKGNSSVDKPQTPAEQQEEHQQLLLQPATAASQSPVLLDLAFYDGHRGWSNTSGLWRQYMQYELSLDRQEAARKLFLRAVHECPGSKGLWLAGCGALCGGMQPRECSGLLTAMQDKEVMLRTDVFEVVLADLAEKQQDNLD